MQEQCIIRRGIVHEFTDPVEDFALIGCRITLLRKIEAEHPDRRAFHLMADLHCPLELFKMGSEIIRDQNLTQGRSQGRKPDSIIIQCLLDLLHFFIRVIDQIFSIHSTHLHIRHSQSFQSCDLSCQFRCDFICKTCDFYCHSFVLLNKCLSYQIQYQCLPFFWKWHVFCQFS